MKTSILRYRDRRASILTLEPSVHAGIRELAKTAATLVVEQDAVLWAKASDSDLLAKIAKGAVYLKHIGHQIGPSILIKDNAAHHAMMACYFVASQSERLCRQCRSDLHTVIEILAECCPFDLPVANLPDPSRFHAGLRMQSIMRKHYPMMRKARHFYELTLADALRLLLVMKRAPSPGLVPVMAALTKATEGLRIALQKADPEKL